MSTLNAQFSAGHFHHSGFPIESGYGMPDEYTEDVFGGRIRKSEEYRRPNTHQFDKHRFERYSSAGSTRAGSSHWTGPSGSSAIARDATGTAVTSVAVAAPTSGPSKPSHPSGKSWRDRGERERHLREKEERRRSAAAQSGGIGAVSMPGAAPVTSAVAYYPSSGTGGGGGSASGTAGTGGGRGSRYMVRTGISDDVLDWRSAAKRVGSDHSRASKTGLGSDELWAEHIDDGTLIDGDGQGEAGDPNSDFWWYQDPKGMVRGPFTRQQMALWFENHYFHKTLPVCCADGQDFIELQQWFSSGNPAFLSEIPQVWPVENEEVEVRTVEDVPVHTDHFSEDIISLPESSEEVDTLEPGVPLGRINSNGHDNGHLDLDFTDIVHSAGHHALGGDTSAYSPSHESSALIGAGSQRHAAIQPREEGGAFDEMLESTAEAMNYWVSADAPLSMDKSDKSGAETPGGFTDSTAHAQQIPLPDSTHHFGDSDIGLTATTTHIPSMADENYFDPVVRSKSEDQPDSAHAFGHDSTLGRHQRSLSLQGFQASLGEADPVYPGLSGASLGLSDSVWRDDPVDFLGADSGADSGLALTGLGGPSTLGRRKPPVGMLKDDQHQSDGFEDVSLTDLMSGLTGGTPPIPPSAAALTDENGMSELDMGAVPSIVTTSSTTTSSGDAGVMISTLSDPPTAQSSRPVALKQATPKKQRTRRRRKPRANRGGSGSSGGNVKSPTGSDGVLGSFSAEVRRPQLHQKPMQKLTPLQREAEELRMRRASATSTRSAGAYPLSSLARPASKTPTVVAGAGAKSVWGAPPSSRSGMIAHTGKRASMPGRMPSNQMSRARGMVARRTSESAVTPSSVGPSPQRIRRQTDPASMTPSAKKSSTTRTKSKNNSTKPVSSAKKSASLAKVTAVKKGGKKASKASGSARSAKGGRTTGVTAGKRAGKKKISKVPPKSKSKSLPPAVMSEDFKKWCASEIRNIDSTLNAKVIVQLLATCNDEASLKECAFDIFGGDSGNTASFLNGYMLYRRDCSTGHSPAPSPKAQKKRRSGSKR